MIRKLINRFFKFLGNYGIRRILPQEFSDLKLSYLEAANNTIKLFNDFLSDSEKKSSLNTHYHYF